MAEDTVFAIKIIGDDNINIGTTGKGTKSIGSKTMFDGITDSFSAVFKGLGIVSGVAMIAKVVSTNKGAMSVIGNVLKMIGYLIKPITDIVTILLYPILLMLKPIVMMVNKMIAPFYQQAMKLMRSGAQNINQGNIALGMAQMNAGIDVMFSGIQIIVLELLSEVIKGVLNGFVDIVANMTILLLDVVGDFFRPILEFFGVNVDGIINNAKSFILHGSEVIKKGINTAVDTAFGTVSALIIAKNIVISETLGVETDKFRKDANKMLANTFNDAPDSIKNQWDTSLGLTQGFGKHANEAIASTFSGTDGIDTAMKNALDAFKTSGSSKIASAVTAFNKEFDNLKKQQETAKKAANTLFKLSLGPYTASLVKE